MRGQVLTLDGLLLQVRARLGVNAGDEAYCWNVVLRYQSKVLSSAVLINVVCATY